MTENLTGDPIGDAWDALYELDIMRCCWCPSCNYYLPEGEYQPETECVTVTAIERLVDAARVAVLREAIAAHLDHFGPSGNMSRYWLREWAADVEAGREVAANPLPPHEDPDPAAGAARASEEGA